MGKQPGDTAGTMHDAFAEYAEVSSRRWTLLAAILGSGLAFVDGTVVNVALPSIQQKLAADAFDAQWVVESYALFLASLLLVGGVLGDRFGRRRVFMIGIATFALASLGCALSATVVQLIATRAVQGMAAALMVPGSLALISAAYPQAERGAAIGTWSAFSGVTAAIGPVIGGFLVDHYSWTWVFLMNVPIAVVLLVICARRVPESRGTDNDAPIDIVGAAFATLGLAGIVFALIQGPLYGWLSASVLGAAGIGTVALGVFIGVESRAADPLLPLELFRQRDFAGANLLTLLLYGALGGSLYFLPLNLIQVQGYSATGAGAALLPLIAIMFALSRWAGRLVDSLGSRLPLVVGPTVAAAGFALFAVPSIGANYWTSFFPAICVLGLGITITVAPLTTTVMNALGPELAGTASGVNNAISRAAGLLAIALLGIVMSTAFNTHLATALASSQTPPDLAASMLAQRQNLAAMSVPQGIPDATATALRHAIGMAFVAGFREVMLASAAVALVSALCAWLLIGTTGGAIRGRA
jgi:EmrB/QacA subfamily drug resistance transporter